MVWWPEKLLVNRRNWAARTVTIQSLFNVFEIKLNDVLYKWVNWTSGVWFKKFSDFLSPSNDRERFC